VEEWLSPELVREIDLQEGL